MYKSKHIIGKRNGKIHRFALFFTVLMLLCGVLFLFPFTPSHVSADEDSSVNKLQNVIGFRAFGGHPIGGVDESIAKRCHFHSLALGGEMSADIQKFRLSHLVIKF